MAAESPRDDYEVNVPGGPYGEITGGPGGRPVTRAVGVRWK
ncbi:hypothetical protein ACWCOZ_01425 [Streptomyces sp. NPDC001840]